MRFSVKTDYGLRAMMELSSGYGSGPLQSAEIASRRGIPESYLEQLLTSLRKSGLITSQRGAQGGHSLARPPSAVTALDVVRALEGPVVVMDCLDGRDSCRAGDKCGLQSLWSEVRSAIELVLGSVTVEELVSRDRELGSRLMFYI